MRFQRLLFALLLIIVGPCLAQTTVLQTSRHVGDGTGKALDLWLGPETGAELDMMRTCIAAAPPGVNLCKYKFSVPCPAAPASAQTAACANAGAVPPTFAQTRAVTSVAPPKCWSLGDWTPAVGTCVVPPPPPPPIDPIPVPPPLPVDPPASAPTPMPSNQFVPVDPTLVPTPNQNPKGGWSTDKLISTTEVAPGSDIGAFRTGCQVARYAQDDPIVFPGQPGRSHWHTFFGNTGINASSTADSLFNTGNSTCRGGTINRSSYWVPSMVDTRTGAILAPMFESNFYYKSGYAVAPSSIAEVPVGLRMIAGDASGNPDKPSGAVIYACVWDGGNSNWQKSIPTDCQVNGTSWLIMGVDMPQCWDGLNLDSPDHKSHMTNPVNVKANNTGNCPASHPVALPQIAYQILYQIKTAGDTKFWRLSSDNYDNTKPAGYSGHADYFMAWKPEIVKVWTQKCDREMRDCHSHLLGDGRAMVIP